MDNIADRQNVALLIQIKVNQQLANAISVLQSEYAATETTHMFEVVDENRPFIFILFYKLNYINTTKELLVLYTPVII
jgi:hypothetical protein